MKIMIADDEPVMLDRLKNLIPQMFTNDGVVELCGTAENGKELIEMVAQQPSVDLVISDVRMPVMDGLSALVFLRIKYPLIKVVMLSAESATTVKHHASGGTVSENAEHGKKLGMLDQIANRIRKEEELEGKINSILEGCEKLTLDPCEIAEHYGAHGFVRKPVSENKLSHIIKGIESSAAFIKIGMYDSQLEEAV